MRQPLRLMTYAPLWEGLSPLLPVDLPLASPLLVDAAGNATVDGIAVQPEVMDVDVAWASPRLWLDGCHDAFLDFALRLRGLKWLQSGTAGIDNPRFAALLDKGVRLSTNDSMTPAIAEYVLYAVLDHYQRGPERRANRARRQWQPLNFREIAGSEWLIIGYGAIGRHSARLARAHGAHVTGLRRHPDQADDDGAAHSIAAIEQLDEFLPRADVVLMCLPLSDATRDFADAGFFARMRAGATFVNVGRGLSVDEDALLAALDSGHVEHAILDVFRTEPLPAEHPFWGHDKVAMTPHLSGMGHGLLARSDQRFVANLVRYHAGERLLGDISPTR